jgi:alkanesulfonate monooxygenase SsuD/methylene tetrahydromethanopterin reductase-like flavin-dependent oxidoreductase (luciferase family)
MGRAKSVPQVLHFGVMTIQNISWPALVERWQYLDELGFDSAWVADHFTNPWYPDEPWFEGWTLLSALATHTRKIRLGTMVTNISLHNPAVLARQALTVDHVSGGRLELGIGAGGAPTDHTMTGVPDWDPPNVSSGCASSSRSSIICFATRQPRTKAATTASRTRRCTPLSFRSHGRR